MEKGQRRALEAFSKFAQSAGQDGWPVHERLDMYEAFAFRSCDPNGAFESFKCEVYDMLSGYWQVWRPLGANQCWPAGQIFETIKREFSNFTWTGGVTLANFSPSNRMPLLSCLSKMATLKPTRQGYPIMAVTKFLHFYNPALFPIYDEAVIWKIVLEKRFNRDFRVFHEMKRIEYESGYRAVWIANYMAYANWLLSSAHPQFMSVFEEWLAAQPRCERVKGKQFVTRRYATAFEYTIIGAAVVEQTRTF